MWPEQHAVTVFAGLITHDDIVYCNIYFHFYAEAYDQISFWCLYSGNTESFCLYDRAGLVGADGPTHYGVYRPLPVYRINAISSTCE